MKCPRCEQNNPSHAAFCLKCGTPVDGLPPTPKSYADLKGEVERLRHSLGEAREQQTGTSEILRVLSGSPTAVEPVFDTIVENAVRLCDGLFSALCSYDGELIHAVALHNYNAEALGVVRRVYPLRPSRGMLVGRAILERTVVHVPDVEVDAEYQHRELSHSIGFRSALAIPMMRDGAPIGAILVARADPGRFSDSQIALLNTFADQAVIAIENVRLFNETKDALGQQTATSEILRVISTSPTDVQPVFDAIVRNAANVCGAFDAVLALADGDDFVTPAHHGPIPRPIGKTSVHGTVTGRAIREARTVQVEDLLADDDYPIGKELASEIGYRTVLCVPLLRDGTAIGAIGIRRTEVRPFTDKEIGLLQTFADQAVIAIENVRLFRELEARNRDLTATSEILRVIARSPTDVQPVFGAIADSALRLCDAKHGNVFLFDGELIHLAAVVGTDQDGTEAVRRSFPQRPGPASATTRAIRTRQPAIVPDVLQDPEFQLMDLARAQAFRSVMSIPMLRAGEPIGAITVTRAEAGPFSDMQLALLQTFADQAVIAIENVRLFTELQASNRELTMALDQQTATSDILKVISSSPTDVQPVFDAIVRAAVRLCHAVQSNVQLFDGQLMHFVAAHNIGPAAMEMIQRVYPMPPNRNQTASRAILDKAVVHVPDVLEDPDYLRELAVQGGWRSVLSIPMVDKGRPIGALTVTRMEPGLFSDTEIALLQTFADQAVIAIENVRLFKALEEKNQALTDAHAQVTEALDRQTATSEILRVISGSPTEVQPVFDAIAESSVRLCGALFGGVYRFDGELVHLVAHHNYSPDALEYSVGLFPAPLGRRLFATQAIRERGVVNVPDVSAVEGEYPWAGRVARDFGFRSVLVVPMLRGGEPIGAIQVWHADVAPFTDTHIDLLKTFADQAVIAIENVRLFKELQQKNETLTTAHAQVTEALEQQTATSELLKVIGRSTFDLQAVFETLAENAVRLCEAQCGFVFRFDGQLLRFAVGHNVSPAFREYLEQNPIVPGRESNSGRAVLERRTIHNPDVRNDPEYKYGAYWVDPYRSVLAVPMLRADEILGVIVIYRHEVRPFTDNQVALIETFADQAVIAIENARLLAELRERTAELTRSVDELTALADVSRALSSTLDLDMVLTTIVGRAIELSGTDAGTIWEYEPTTEVFHLRAARNLEDDIVGVLRSTPLRRGEGTVGRLADTLAPIQVADITGETAYRARLEVIVRSGYRAILSVPLLREDQLIGALTVNAKTPREFPPAVVDLLTTFATQSALAIQNARLFREIEQKSRELEAASRHKSEFLANMSHELRTPLNAIIGFSEVLSERMFGELNEKQDEYLKDIHASGQHLLSLINDILDLSKIEAGRMELEVTDFDLPMAIDNALTLIRERAARRSIALHTTVDERLGHVQGDERKIRQVLLNLLSNAIKFTPEGGRIHVEARSVNESVEVSLTDTGVGIAPEDQEAVFEEFRQVGTADKKVEGTGLGLALSRKFIELHGGKIWVKSQVGQGSRFTFTVPVRRGE
jgi:GAF domain-containing protein